MAVLVNNLLHSAAAVSSNIDPGSARRDRELSRACALPFTDSEIEVLREFAGELPTIQADRQQLRQLFLNLLTNASDAMPEGGQLTVRAALNGSGAAAVALEFPTTVRHCP